MVFSECLTNLTIMRLLIIFCICFSANILMGQYESGETYFGENDYTEYRAGNLPLIIVAPHGGLLKPNDIPDRDCSACVTSNDLNTQELVRQIDSAVYDLFGCYPHIIINHLHRSKMDANRALIEAAQGNADAVQAWNDFHQFIEAANTTVENEYGKGLYLDMHGHGHDIDRLELGYRVSGSDLRMPDSQLNNPDIIESSSIVHLVDNNLQNINFTELIRGPNSLGELLEQKNFDAVPSNTTPTPFSGEAYFSGGYNTDRYGSSDGGTVDAIQIECHRPGLRDSYENRKTFALALSSSLETYLKLFYFDLPSMQNICSLVSAKEIIDSDADFEIYPNPSTDFLTLNYGQEISKLNVKLINLTGVELLNSTLTQPISPYTIELPKLDNGMYIVKIVADGKLLRAKNIIIVSN